MNSGPLKLWEVKQKGHSRFMHGLFYRQASSCNCDAARYASPSQPNIEDGGTYFDSLEHVNGCLLVRARARELCINTQIPQETLNHHKRVSYVQVSNDQQAYHGHIHMWMDQWWCIGLRGSTR